jgi:hypothetical protein
MTKAKFYGWAIAQLIESSVDIKLLQKWSSDKAGGFFIYPEEGEDPQFMVCLKNDVAFELFIHEFCHFLQWRDGPKKIHAGFDRAAKFWDWLNNKRKINPGVDLLQELELDCEKRAVRLIKKYNLPVDITKYCQSANVYISSYLFIEEKRSWFKRSGASTNPDIYSYFPDTLKRIDYYRDKENLPEEAMNLLETYF